MLYLYRSFIDVALLFFLAAGTAAAAEVRFVGMEPFISLRIQGQIESGDLDRLLTELSQANNGKAGLRFFQERQYITINSPGGSVDEAMKIAAFVRKALIPVWVLDRCESACFIILAAAVERQMTGNIGIHRPYFTDESSSSLSVEESQRRYAKMSARFYSMLDEFETPRQITDRMHSIASTEVYYLTDADRNLIGEKSPWFEQLLISKCGLDKRREAEMREEIYRRYIAKDEQWRPPPDYQAYGKSVKSCTNRLTFDIASDAYSSETLAMVRRWEAGKKK